MIYKAGESITFVAYYTSSGVAKTGLTDVIAKVVRIGYGEVASPSVVEEGYGFYSCTFTPSEDGVYVCQFKTDDNTVDQKELAAIAFRGVGGHNNLDAAVSTRLASADYTPPPSVDEIDDRLTSSHGAGSWQAVGVEPIVLRLSADELAALLDGQSRRPISVFRGDSLELDITVVDSSGDPVDLTGASAVFTAKTSESDEEPVIQKSLDIYDPPAGKMRLSLSETDTRLPVSIYPADIEITLSDGRVKTVWSSHLQIKWDVSR